MGVRMEICLLKCFFELFVEYGHHNSSYSERRTFQERKMRGNVHLLIKGKFRFSLNQFDLISREIQMKLALVSFLCEILKFFTLRIVAE